MKFSVCIPVFNHQEFLIEAVLSALRCEMVDEVLLVDDGSTDTSPEIIKSLARSSGNRIRDLTNPNEGNLGAHSRLNQLIEASSCEWIAILNSDDCFIPGRFEQAARAILAYKPDFIFGFLMIMNEMSEIVARKRGPFDPEFPFPEQMEISERISKNQYLPLLLNQNFVATTSNMIFNRSVYEEIGGFANFRYVHDWDFALRATQKAKCLLVPYYLTSYRVHDRNTIKENAALTRIEVKQLIDKFLIDFAEVTQEDGAVLGMSANQYISEESPFVST